MRSRCLLALFVPLLGCDKSSQPAPAADPTAPSALLEPASVALDDATAPSPSPPVAAHADTTLIPRSTLETADYLRVRISPDGKLLGWLAPVNGVRNVWVAPATDLASARPVTHEALRHIRNWEFRESSAVLYGHDNNGDENTHVIFVDLASGLSRDLTPVEGVRSTLEATSGKDLRHVVIGQNSRDPRVADLYRVDVVTGEQTLLMQNPGDYSAWQVDNRLRVTGAHRANPDGSLDVLSFDPKLGTRSVLHVPFEDVGTTELLGHDSGAGVQYLKDSRGRDTAALVAENVQTGALQVLAEDAHADLGAVFSHSKPRAVSFNYDHTRWQVLDPTVQADFDYLQTVAEGDLSIDSRSSDDKRWVVSYRASNRPRVSYLYDRSATPGVAGRATLLFSQSKELAGLALPTTRPVTLKARDGRELLGYLTVPLAADPTGTGRPTHPMPMVLWVHGGPQEREIGAFDESAQWLANRGYVVLKVNFRGSTGFGKAFLNAGNGQYAGTMLDDLDDGVAWAVSQKIADPSRMAVVGGSYGGYAALMELESTPKSFACGVDMSGMTDLGARLAAVPFTEPSGAWEIRRVGDPTTEAGRAALLEASPIAHVATLRGPLLMFTGANDVRVRKADVDRFVEATKPLKVPVTYAVYPDEGHTRDRPQNTLTQAALTELFLAKCLGGAYQPMGNDNAGSSLTLPLGESLLSTLP